MDSDDEESVLDAQHVPLPGSPFVEPLREDDNPGEAGFSHDQSIWLLSRFGRASSIILEMQKEAFGLRQSFEAAEAQKANLMHEISEMTSSFKTLESAVERLSRGDADTGALLGEHGINIQNLEAFLKSPDNRSAGSSREQKDTDLMLQKQMFPNPFKSQIKD